LFAIDDALGDVVARAREPALAAIKLEWWRERLEELDQGKVPAEPRLQTAAAELLTRGVIGASLAGLEDGWAALLDEQPDRERVAERGARLFVMAASLLGASDPRIETAGRLYGWQSAVRRGVTLPPPQEELRSLAGHRFERRLRPLTALAALAARDARRGQAIEPEGTPGRALALIRHRFTGRVA
jgi:phytoene synthase